MYCNHCGKEIVENSAFCVYCGTKVSAIESQLQNEEQSMLPAVIEKSEISTQMAKSRCPSVSDVHRLKCPRCGSTNLHFTTVTENKFFSGTSACCGAVCLGPIGILCGLCGAGSETTNFWVCYDCGNEFFASEYQAVVNKKLRQDKQMAKKAAEHAAQVITWKALLDSCPYDSEQIEKIYLDTSDKAEKAAAHYQECYKREKNSNSQWRLISIGKIIGILLILLGLLALLLGAGFLRSIVIVLAGFVLIFVMYSADEMMFEKYASEELKNARDEKTSGEEEKKEIEKYKEAYVGLKADALERES